MGIAHRTGSTKQIAPKGRNIRAMDEVHRAKGRNIGAMDEVHRAKGRNIIMMGIVYRYGEARNK